MVEEAVCPSIVRDDFPKPVHVVSVRDLVEFVWRRGDLGAGQLFVGPRRALAGIRGHQKIQRSRPSGYQTEIAIELPVETDEFTLLVRGRIDGLLNSPGEVWLEEIKTIQGTGELSADPLHWAQAKIYGFSYVQEQGLHELAIRLTYLELETGKITEFQQIFSLAELSGCFADTLAVYLDWLKERHAWCRKRDASIRTLRFPYPAYRRGQRELMEAAERVLDDGGRLFLAAPTGIGKTISVLFPAIKALGAGSLERIFYLTARTVGRLIAENACADLRATGLKLQVVTLTAKEKVCPQGDALCDALVCPLAAGYFDRNKAAMREALGHEAMTRAVLEDVARKHQVCPFELSLDVSVWSDAVICDYNYVFDPKVYLRRHFAEGGGSNGFLVDEAHNLVDRAREMFSAELDYRENEAVRRALGRNAPRVAKALVKLNAELQKLGDLGQSGLVMEASDPPRELNLFPVDVRPVHDGTGGVRASRELPGGLVGLLETALEEMENWLSKNKPASFREALLALYFRLYRFRRTAEYFDERFVTLSNSNSSGTVRLFCMDPSFLLREALNRVLQAIGRVIRSETDRGVVLLIDARFGELRYRRLFPPWWKFLRVRNVGALSNAVATFWQGAC